MQKKWQIAPQISQETKNQFPEIDPLVLQLLFNRGIKHQEEIDEFLNPDYSQDFYNPFHFRDMEKAVRRILEAVQRKERVVIHGDYDADGICSAAILASFFKKVGSQFEVYLPHRETEGYGLSKETIEELAKNNFQLIITCDCGITSTSEVKLAKKLNLEVIVTDHHMPAEKLPREALAIINPHLKGETYPFKDLAGAGVAFKLVQGLIRSYSKSLSSKEKDLWESFEKWLLDLVAIGTVADCMRLLGENRTLVKYGLIVLNKTRRLGLKKLIEVSRLQIRPNLELATHNISFQIGPRLNAAGRINHANLAYKLIMSEDEVGAQDLANGLNKTNQTRQTLTEAIAQEVKKQIGSVEKQKILFARGKDWPLGIIGLVASKITDEFYRPALVLTEREDRLEGSARSIPEFDIIKALQSAPHFFSQFGGHPQAAGFVLRSEKVFGEFKRVLKERVEEELKDVELAPRLSIESEVSLEEIDWDFYEAQKQFEPFGQGNPKPKYLARDLQVIGLERVGPNGKHLRVMVSHKSAIIRKTIGFCLGQWCQKIKMGDRIDMVLEVDVNEWNGHRELQLKIVDLKLLE